MLQFPVQARGDRQEGDAGYHVDVIPEMNQRLFDVIQSYTFDDHYNAITLYLYMIQSFMNKYPAS